MTARALDNLGPHLLGRIPSYPDPRDWQLARLEEVMAEDPLLTALRVLQRGTGAKSVKDWAALATARIIGNAPPGPTGPPPPSGDVEWAHPDKALDQGQTPHCGGFGWAQFGNVAPFDDHYTNADGHAIYYEIKVVEGQPKQENGCSIRGGATAMVNRGRISGYGFAADIAGVKDWVRTKGSIVLGTDWTNDMFNPDAQGYIHPTGSLAGGHCYDIIGDLVADKAAVCLNSWGNWAKAGVFLIKWTDVESLVFGRGGEACAALELAV